MTSLNGNNGSEPNYPPPVCIDLTEDEEGLAVKKLVLADEVIGGASCKQAGTSKSTLPSTSMLETKQEYRVCSKCKRNVIGRLRPLDCSHILCYSCIIRTLKNNLKTINHCPVLNCKRPISDGVIKKNLMIGDYIAFLEHSRNNYRRANGELPAASIEEIDLCEEPTGFTDLQKVYEKKYVPNFEPFDCPICYLDIPINGGIILKSCFHQFCQGCIIETVRHSHSAQVFCPYDNQGHQSCNFTILDSELRAIVPADILEMHLKKSLKQGETVLDDVFHCKAPNCDGFVVKGIDTFAFVCPVCEIVNCVKCNAIHEEKTCEQYQEDIKIDSANQRDLLLTTEAVEELLKKGEAMRCPQCDILIQKIAGCDFVQCASCKLGICYRTMKPRNPLKKVVNGVQIIIDGCHCREKGQQKCHPKCANCH